MTRGELHEDEKEQYDEKIIRRKRRKCEGERRI
jgi:hypothetical protein